MPANLNYKFIAAEKSFRNATTLSEELECLQMMLREIPKHKGTDKLQAELKRKISKARLELEKGSKQNRASFRLPRQGAGRVVMIGPPNSGKSQLLASATRATPTIAPYPFTTIKPMPGMMPWNDVTFQLVDTAPITNELFDADSQSLIRGADLVLLLLDLGSDDGADQLIGLLNNVQNSKTRLANENSIDASDVGVTYTKTFLIRNKIDLEEAPDRIEFFAEVFNASSIAINFPTMELSALSRSGFELLGESIFNALDVARVYTKDPEQKEADLSNPYTIKIGTPLIELAKQIHEDLAENFRSARIWGDGHHDGTIVNGDYCCKDQDIVEILTK